MKIWVGDRLFDRDEARVSVLDHGFTVGDGVFETIKTIDGVPFALARHLDRLERSAVGMLLQVPERARLISAIASVLSANPVPGLGRLRLTWTGGIGPSGSGRDPAAEPTLVITHMPTTSWAERAKIVTVDFPRNERSPLAGIKSTSYAENVLALAFANEKGADEAIFGNTRGELCEGTGSNIFLVVGEELLTPPLSSGCLPGITRSLAIEWCGAREIAMPISVLMEAEEILLASTTRDLQTVGQVNARIMPPATRRGREAKDAFAANAGTRLDP
ncbi:MAG TPA: aminotransferase class IV [Candidatus Nanopelagicaceae bacterium]|nr:aminotransferase class IV [Candidatus Nanopelagicaceae bacterium]